MSGRCDCGGARLCPLGRTGHATRCSAEDLRAALLEKMGLADSPEQRLNDLLRSLERDTRSCEPTVSDFTLAGHVRELAEIVRDVVKERKG